jgi:CARDB
MAVPDQVLSICSSQDGRIELLTILAVKPDYILHTNQTEARTWANWTACDQNSSKFAQLVSALDGSGRLALAWLNDGQIWVSAANQPNGDISNSFPLDTQDLQQLKLLTNLDGRLEFLALSKKNDLYSVAQSEAGSWSNMAIYYLDGTELQQIAGTRYGDGRLTAVALGKDEQVYRKEQNGPGDFWGDWMGLGGTDIQGIAAAANADGRLEVMVTGGDGNLYDYYQTTTGGWSGWQLAVKGSFVGPPQLAINQDGRLEVFASDKNGSIYHTFQTEKNGAWIDTPVEVAPGQQYPVFSVTALTDGRLALVGNVYCAFIFYVQPKINATSLTNITGPNPPCAPQVSFSASPNPVTSGGTETLSWEVSGCEQYDISLVAENDLGSLTIPPAPPADVWGPNGMATVTMTKSAKFTLTAGCAGSPFTTIKSHSINVAQPNPPEAVLQMTIAFNPALPAGGTNYTVNVTVANLGNLAMPAFSVKLTITGTASYTVTKSAPAIQPSGSTVVPFPLTAPSLGNLDYVWTIPGYPVSASASRSFTS